MRTDGRSFSLDDSLQRIKSALGETDFNELDSIPSADRLTFNNGFYVNRCTALFIDIRGSSNLTNTHTRPVLAKIYRAYLSECVAILNQDKNCKEIFICGDCVSGIFNTQLSSDVNDVFYRAAELNSIISVLNWQFEQKGYVPIKCGIGLDYGRALMVKGGLPGTGINEIIWMGDVVNGASNLCHKGGKDGNKTVQASPAFYERMSNIEYKNSLSAQITNSLSGVPSRYQGDPRSKTFEDWLDDKKKTRSILDLGEILSSVAKSGSGLGGLMRSPPQQYSNPLLGMLERPKLSELNILTEALGKYGKK